MKKSRTIFYALFAVFHLGAFIFTVILDNNTSLLFSMVQYVPLFKYVTLMGLVFLVVDFVWALRATKDLEKEKSTLNHELNTLKAKLFDLQEASKK
jgi:hypothetical protein